MLANGGTVTNPNNRNVLLQDWLTALGGNPPVINLRYTFDGIGDYISCDITLGFGDKVSIDFTAPTTSYGDSRFIATARGGFAAIGVNASGGLRVNDFNGVTLDGVPISAGDVMPLDGADHVLVSTVSVTTAYIDWIGAYVGSGTPTLLTSIPLWDVKVNGGSVYDYKINDGWLANPKIANSGSGADATLINGREAGWNEVVPPAGLTFISLEEIASARLFGVASHTFNLTAPAETDGVVFVALVQKKNQGVNITSIKVDGGAVVDAMYSIDSNPGGATNQLTAFEDKTFGLGAHTVEVDNLDGIEGATIVAVYYKSYTGLTGNFTGAGATGVQPEELNIGNASWPVTTGNRGLNIVFSGGLNSALSQTPDPEYSSGVMTYNTTDVNNDPYNGVLKTAADLAFVAPVSDQQWLVKWTSAGVNAEVISLGAELSST